ncbi:MAG TPA: AAA family ATPase [Saprospiraceae bacterium]|nr:AAA family ATPase [Saprospiraceae bacterium]
MSTHIGPPAKGSNFFGRTKMIDRIKNVISKGTHILLSAPRRVGKTSLAMRILYLIQKENWNGIYVTLEGAKDETIVAQRIISALKDQESLWKKTKDSFISMFKSANIEIDAFGAKIKYTHNDNSVEQLLETLGKAINQMKGNFLVVLDELPVFLASLETKEDGIARVETMLNVLRSFRQYDNGEEYDVKDKKVWFFCGSISLENYAAQRNLSYTINDIKPYKLGAYDQEETIDFLRLAAKRSMIDLDSEVSNHIISKVGWPIPFYLAIVFDAAMNEMADKTMTIVHVDEGYKKALEEHKKDFDLWIQRLQLHIKDAEIHIEFLKLIAKGKSVNLEFLKAFILGSEWSNTKELQILDILDQLESDGYIVLENQVYQFRSPLIRDYIIQKFHIALP